MSDSVSISKKRKNKNQTKYFIVIAKNCIVPFGELFNEPEYDKHKFFKITLMSKKVYARLIDIICERNNELLNRDKALGEAFIYKYFTLKKKVDENKYFCKKDLFVYDLLRELFDSETLELIRSYVDDNFVTEIDPRYEENKDGKFEEGPMFLARHYKVIFQVSSMINLVIPLAIQFVQNNPQEKIEVSTFFTDILIKLFKYAETGTVINTYQKLFKLVERKVNSKTYTDSYGMDMQAIYGVTQTGVVDEILIKILTTIVPKADYAKDIIKLIDVVIKYHLNEYLFRGKFSYTAKPTVIDDGEGSANGEDNNEAELFESYNGTKRDERTHLLRSVLPSFTIMDMEKIYKIDYLPGELEFYADTLEKNKLQELLLSQVFSKDFGGTDNMYGCNKEDFLKLCVILVKRMRRYDINLLADYITAKKTNAIISRYQYRNIHKKLQAHPKYQEVLEKYKGVQNLFINKIANKFDKNNPMMENLILIFNNNYVKNTYLDSDNGKPLPKLEDVIIDEMLKVYTLLIY